MCMMRKLDDSLIIFVLDLYWTSDYYLNKHINKLKIKEREKSNYLKLILFSSAIVIINLIRIIDCLCYLTKNLEKNFDCF